MTKRAIPNLEPTRADFFMGGGYYMRVVFLCSFIDCIECFQDFFLFMLPSFEGLPLRTSLASSTSRPSMFEFFVFAHIEGPAALYVCGPHLSH